MTPLDASVAWDGDVQSALDAVSRSPLATRTVEDLGVLTASLITALSEDAWCARWLMGVEFVAWAAAQPDADPARLPAWPGEATAALVALREALGGGWVAWADAPPEGQEPGVYLLDATTWSALRAEGAT